MIPTSQPSRKPTLVAFARGDSNIRMTAMIGTGLIAIPTASGRISPMTEPTANLPDCFCDLPLTGIDAQWHSLNYPVQLTMRVSDSRRNTLAAALRTNDHE